MRHRSGICCFPFGIFFFAFVFIIIKASISLRIIIILRPLG
nr:MAG TPA: hypothetical protein [Caudoviricetes sp.]